VPTFKDGDLVVNESGAICMYLEEKYSKDSNKLLPADVNKRAEVYQRMFESPNLQTNVTEKLVYYRWMNKEEEWDKKYLEGWLIYLYSDNCDVTFFFTSHGVNFSGASNSI
jgi:glutathione S-transferase